MNQWKAEHKGTSIFETVKWGESFLQDANRPDASIDAKLLMRFLLGFSETDFLLKRHERISDSIRDTYVNKIKQRAEGIPLQYITNSQEFMGLEFYVDERVLIPRQDTETLVEKLIEMNHKEQFETGIDIGTGSGCISIALAHSIQALKMIAIDVSQDALTVAKRNIEALNLEDRISTLWSDVFDSYELVEPVDLIVSNPPYISEEDCRTLMTEVRGHEPHLALTDGGDGLKFYRMISKEAKAYLKEGGIIAYEIGYNQGEAVTTILKDEGYKDIELIQDLAGKDRVVIGRK